MGVKKSTAQPALEQAAKQHQQISSLLRVKRDTDKKRAVEEIMRTSTSLEWKISQIKRIDTASQQPKTTSVAQGSGDPVITANRRRLKNKPRYNSLLTYLFQDLPKIREFGRKTHIFTTGLLPFRLKLNREVQHFFMEYLQKRYLTTLLPVVNHVARQGWKWLTRREYNLCIVFQQLCTDIFALDFNLLPYSDRHLIDKLSSIETGFLILWARPEYLDQLCQALHKGIGKESKYNRDKEELEVRIKRILSPELTLPSLYNFLLGLNMHKYHCFLKLPTLLNKEAGHLLSSQEFDCSDTIRNQITMFITETEKSLQPIIQRRNEIMKMKAFLPPARAENPFELLEFFYEDKKSDPPRIFSRDKENIITFTLNLADRFMALTARLLNGFVKIETSGPVEIFSHRFFALELNKLGNLQEKLAKLSYCLASLSPERFQDLLIFPRNALTIELETVQTIDGLASLLVEIGQKLAQVILGRREASKEQLQLYIRLEPEILGHRSYCIPHASARIISQDFLHGRTILDALSLCCCTCMLCGQFFRNSAIYNLIGNEEKIKLKIQNELGILKRLDSPEAFEAFRHTHKV